MGATFGQGSGASMYRRVRSALGKALKRYRHCGRPLSAREISRGVALRAFACATLGEHVVHLDLRVLHSDEHPDVLSVRARTEGGVELPVRHRTSTTVEGPRGARDWIESQYVLEVPGDAGALYVDVMREDGGNILESATLRRSLWHDRLVGEFYARVRNPFADGEYVSWFEEHRASEAQLARQRAVAFENGPLFSVVVPVYRTPPEYLSGMIDSVLAQSYGNWELVVVNASPDDEDVSCVLSSYDDARIRVLEHPENDGINGNTNFGIAATRGDYVVFIDHDDLIEPDLLFEYASVIEREPGVALLYCDEDSFEVEGVFVLPLFKPDFNIDLLYSNNYVIHALAVSRDVIEHAERSPHEVNGAQDYDLTLKACERSDRVVHVPRVLYHWRMHESSSNGGNYEAKPYASMAGARALDAHFERAGLGARAEETDVPYVYRCLPDLAEASSFARVTANDAATRNAAARVADAELLLFADEDLRMLDADAGEVLASYFERKDVGLVAPRMIAPDGLSCAQWLVLRRDLGATRMGYDLPDADAGYIGRFHRPCDVTAVDGACCMVRRAEFLEMSGYDEGFRTLAYASIDLCLRYRARGQRVVFAPFARFEHAQELVETFLPRTRGYEDDLAHDRALLADRWPQLVGEPDPLYNPNLDETSPYFLLG